jgi:hypothetical protein
VADFLARETPFVVEEVEELAMHSPFREPNASRSQSRKDR